VSEVRSTKRAMNPIRRFPRSPTADNIGKLRGDARAVLTAARRKHPPDSKRKPCAMRLAKRYEELLPKVKESFGHLLETTLIVQTNKS
jgi:hypothetical protein